MNRRTRLLIALVCIAVLGISGILRGRNETAEIAKGMTDFNHMSREDFYPGGFVNGNVTGVFGKFAYREAEHETLGSKLGSKVSANYYLIPMSGSFDKGKPLFIAMEIKSEEGIRNADLLMEQTYDFIDTGNEPEIWNEFPVQGKVSALDSELEGYLYRWLTNDGKDGTRADYDDMICPYLIIEKDDKAISSETVSGIVMCLIGFGGMGIMLLIYVKSRSSENTSQPFPSVDPFNASSVLGSQLFGDGGKSERLMEEMSRLKQPTDADEFFGSPLRCEKQNGTDISRGDK